MTDSIYNDDSCQRCGTLERWCKCPPAKIKTLTVELTPAELEKLTEIFLDYQDEGPWDEGWLSDLARQLKNKIEAAIKEIT